VNALIFAPLAQRELRAAAVWMAEDNPAAADALLAAAMAAARGYKRGRNSGGLGRTLPSFERKLLI
jgi:plasmid stabilization system protein ParE